jgi:hypothetical protein
LNVKTGQLDLFLYGIFEYRDGFSWLLGVREAMARLILALLAILSADRGQRGEAAAAIAEVLSTKSEKRHRYLNKVEV